MTIGRRIERLERNDPAESKATAERDKRIEEWLKEYAKPFEHDEESEQVRKIIEQLDNGERTNTPMNLYPKVFFGLLTDEVQ